MILGAIERALAAQGVARQGSETVLVACSGGCDSVVLAHATPALLGGRRVRLGHVDHGTRPDSAQDAEFVREFAARLGVHAHVVKVTPKSDAEADLRDARYRALKTVARMTNSAAILTAHTADDQAETVLMAMLRTGEPEPMRGISDAIGQVLRPLLAVSRSAVSDYAEKHELAFVHDLSNREPRYLRNRVRKELLPLIERRYQPRIVARLMNLSARLKELEAGGAPSPSPPTSAFAVRVTKRRWSEGDAIPNEREAVVFDARALHAPQVRTARTGDTLRPFGFHADQKVTEVLRAAGIPVSDRSAAPVVVDDAGQVIWVVGARRGAEHAVDDETEWVWLFSLGSEEK